MNIEYKSSSYLMVWWFLC